MICGDVPENMMSALKLMPPIEYVKVTPDYQRFWHLSIFQVFNDAQYKGNNNTENDYQAPRIRLSIPDVNIVAEMAASVDLVKDMNTRSIKNRASKTKKKYHVP